MNGLETQELGQIWRWRGTEGHRQVAADTEQQRADKWKVRNRQRPQSKSAEPWREIDGLRQPQPEGTETCQERLGPRG